MSISLNATTLCTNSLRLAGILSDGDTADSAMLADAFSLLNELIDGMGVQRQTMIARPRAVFNLTANQSTYTYGPGGDFSAVRPVTVEGCGLILNSSTPSLEIALSPLSDDQYQAIGIKALTSTLPTEYYFNPTINALGQASLFLWPTPTVNTNQLAVYVPVAVTQFPDLTTTTILAPGYARYLRYGLAREVCVGIRPIPPDVERLYQECVTWLKAVNVHLSDLSIDPALASQGDAPYGYNILSDQGA